jgi:hypothetical protein
MLSCFEQLAASLCSINFTVHIKPNLPTWRGAQAIGEARGKSQDQMMMISFIFLFGWEHTTGLLALYEWCSTCLMQDVPVSGRNPAQKEENLASVAAN